MNARPVQQWVGRLLRVASVVVSLRFPPHEGNSRNLGITVLCVALYAAGFVLGYRASALRQQRRLLGFTLTIIPFWLAAEYRLLDLEGSAFAHLAANGIALTGLWFFLLAGLSGEKGEGSLTEVLVGAARDVARKVKTWTSEGIDQPWSVGDAIGIALRAMLRRPGVALGFAFFWFVTLGVLASTAVLALSAAPSPFADLGKLDASGLGGAVKVTGPTNTGLVAKALLLASRDRMYGYDPVTPQVGGILLTGLLVVVVLLTLATTYLSEASLAAVRDEKVPPGALVRALARTPKVLVLYLCSAGLLAFTVAIDVGAANFQTSASFVLVTLAALTLGALMIVTTRLVYAPFFVIDEDASIGEALAKSTRVTGQYWVGILILGLALLPVVLLGVGTVVLLAVAIPFIVLALAFTYVRATGRNEIPWLEADFATKSVRRYLGVTFAVLMALFVLFSGWVSTLPTMRGSAWSIRDTAIRASAILTGVGAIIVALAFVLPYLLDALEGKKANPAFWKTLARVLTTLSLVAIVVAGFVSAGLAKNAEAAGLRAVPAVVALIVLLGRLAFALWHRKPSFSAFVAARHVRSPKSGFLTVISILSICGVAMSSCSLSSVVSVMGGFSADLKRKILGNNAHIVVDMTAGTPFAGYEEALERVRGVPGVTGAAAVMHGEVMASSASNIAGVMVSGVEPADIVKVNELATSLEVGKLDYLEHPEKLSRLPPNEPIGIGPGGEQYFKQSELPPLTDDIDESVRKVLIDKPDRPGIILGRELAKTLHVYVGDEITLVSPLGDLGPMGILPRTKKFRVAGVFYSGMYEYDATYVYTMLDVAQDYFQSPGKVSTLEIKVDDAERAEQIAPLVEEAVARPDLRVRDWREINKNLFSALKLERFATFVILLIAILVASFCIVCTLLLMVTEKGKEIAILKAIGASDRAILTIFMIEGIIIGGIGTVFGVATGLSVCAGLKWFGLRLDPEVYYIDKLPITVNPWDFLAVALAAMTICTLSTIYPAYAASRLRPVDGLRYE